MRPWPFRERFAILKDTTLRFLVNSVSRGGPLLRTLLVCASSSLQACTCPPCTASIRVALLAKEGGLFGDGTVKTHARSRRLLGRRSLTVPQRTVEVAVEFETGLPRSSIARCIEHRNMMDVALP